MSLGHTLPVESLAWRIEPAQVGDVPSMVAVHQEAFVQGYENVEEPEFGATGEALQAFVSGEFAERKKSYWTEAATRGLGVYVARLCTGGEVVGIGEAVDDEITGMYVLPAYHRIGIGSALLQAVLADLQPAIIRAEVTRWAPAARFYQNRGFVPTNRTVSAPDPPKAYGITLEQTEMELRR